MTVGVQRSHLVLLALLPLLLMGCFVGPGDPTYYLFANNRSADAALIRLVWIANKSEGIADPVYRAAPNHATWLIEPRTGNGPDAVELITPACQVVVRLEPIGTSGAISLDGVHRPVLEAAASPPDYVSMPIETQQCPDR
jgi:hypothetical protein